MTYCYAPELDVKNYPKTEVGWHSPDYIGSGLGASPGGRYDGGFSPGYIGCALECYGPAADPIRRIQL